MPHQVFKATVKGSKGDLAAITAAIHGITNGPDNRKVNIRAIAAGESAVVGGVELGVVTMILEPDDPAWTTAIINAITAAQLDPGPGGAARHVEEVKTYPNVQVTLLDAPGSLNAALGPISAANLNMVSVIPLGSGPGVQTVGLGFEDDAHADQARTALGGANVIVHPAEED
jgi:hypothetical protein